MMRPAQKSKTVGMEFAGVQERKMVASGTIEENI